MKPEPDPPANDPGGHAAPALPDHIPIIGRSFFVYTRIRTMVVVTMLLAAFFARYVLLMQAIDVRRITIVAMCIALYNVAAWAFFRRFRDPDLPDLVYRGLLGVSYGAVVLDMVALTAVIWLLGGCRSPFCALYLPHVMVTCILLSRRASVTLAALGYALLVGLVVVEATGMAVPPLPVGAVAGNEPLGGAFACTLVLVYTMLFSLSVFLLQGLIGSLRSVERRIRLANDELLRLSQQRKDFLHIAAHNLRAPVGAVSMMLENMRTGLAGEVNEKQRDWLDRSLRRLGDLSDFMNDIQTLSNIEADIIKTQFARVYLPAVVARLVEQYHDIAEAHLHTLTLEVPDPVPPVMGHARLLQEAIVNYITNAIKYTPDCGRIVVRVIPRDSMVRVEVEDNGIGIAKEDEGRLFREFVRLAPKDAEAGKVKGSGLGLSIVRRVALAHGGQTGFDSEPGKGSTFYLEIPALRE